MAKIVLPSFNVNGVVARSGYKSPWKSHRQRWCHCQDCRLGKIAHNHCLLFCDPPTFPFEVLFIGEAPGREEDNLGVPFVGPAGSVLRAMVEETFTHVDKYSYGFANVMGCRPITPGEGHNFRQPFLDEVMACHPRILNLYNLLRPELRLVVLLGKVAQESPIGRRIACDADEGLSVCDLWHPSYIKRNGGVGSNTYCIAHDKLVDALCQALHRKDRNAGKKTFPFKTAVHRPQQTKTKTQGKGKTQTKTKAKTQTKAKTKTKGEAKA